MRNIISILLLALLWVSQSVGQVKLARDPDSAVFVKSDIALFWKAFDRIENGKNPFVEYLEKGSVGVKDFIPYRIESAKNLLKTVQSRKQDYEKVRQQTDSIDHVESIIRSHYRNFRTIYPEAVFPPVYFIIGAFNAGGGVTDNGLVIGTEVAKDDFPNIIYFVVHELMHFNQRYDKKPIGKATLLEQSIIEGSADFLASLIMKRAYKVEYAEAHQEELCREFAGIMDGTKFHGWLYGSKGKKEGRPNDLGYWMGYKIVKAYYEQIENKSQALHDILNISDFQKFYIQSGYPGKE